ncbi:MAG: hypothetical protein ACRD22_13145 [Terriglobia bacterium]
MTDDTAEFDWYDARFDLYAQAVGRIAGTWAQLEFAINQAIYQLANVEAGIGACITAQIIIIGPRMRALIALIDYRFGDSASNDKLMKKLNHFIQKVEGLARQRNRFVHDPVTLNKVTGILSRVEVTADRRLVFDFQPVNLKEMDSLHKKIRATIVEFDKIFEECIAALPPWPQTQFERSPRGVRRQRSQDNDPPIPPLPPQPSRG